MMDKISILKQNGYKEKVDSTLMAWKKQDLVNLIRILENNWAIALERCENQYKLLMRNYENKAEYESHDLRKNPNDLPSKDGEYLVKIRVKPNETWGIEECYVYKVMNFVDGRFKVNNLCEVIAWREIEHF